MYITWKSLNQCIHYNWQHKLAVDCGPVTSTGTYIEILWMIKNET